MTVIAKKWTQFLELLISSLNQKSYWRVSLIALEIHAKDIDKKRVSIAGSWISHHYWGGWTVISEIGIETGDVER